MGKVTTEVQPPKENNFVQPFHAYEAVLTPNDDKGYTQLMVKTIGAKGRDWDKVSAKQGAKYHDDKLVKWADAVVKSNAGMQPYAKTTDIDTDKWGGLKVGVLYCPDSDLNPVTGEYEDNQYCKPWILIPISQVATHKVNEAKYDAWCKKFGKGKYYSSGETAQSEAPSAPYTPAPIDDDLPF